MEDSRIKVAQALLAIWKVTPKGEYISGGRVVKVSGIHAKLVHVHLRWLQRKGYIFCPKGKRGWEITKALAEFALAYQWELDSAPPTLKFFENLER